MNSGSVVRDVAHLAELVRPAGIVKDALGGCGFTGIDVRCNADVPHPLERYRSWHKKSDVGC